MILKYGKLKCPLCGDKLEIKYEDDHREVTEEDFTFEDFIFEFDGDAFEEGPFIIEHVKKSCAAEFEIEDEGHIIYYNSDGNDGGIFEGEWKDIDPFEYIQNGEIVYLDE